MLPPALPLAAMAIIEGKLEGIDRLLEVIDRLDKLLPPTPHRLYDANVRRKLLAKSNLNMDGIQEAQARKAENAPEAPANP